MARLPGLHGKPIDLACMCQTIRFVKYSKPVVRRLYSRHFSLIKLAIGFMALL